MRLGTARLRGLLPGAQHILANLVIERGERSAHLCRLEFRRMSAALWPHVALRLLPRLLAAVDKAPDKNKRAVAIRRMSPDTRIGFTRRTLPGRTPRP
jgi:hypothetical protein